MIPGPFTLRGDKTLWWDIADGTGCYRLSIPSQLIDGSRQKVKYPTGVIRTRDEQEAFAKFVVAAMNQALLDAVKHQPHSVYDQLTPLYKQRLIGCVLQFIGGQLSLVRDFVGRIHRLRSVGRADIMDKSKEI